MGYFIVAFLMLGIVILAIPISLGYDSAEGWFRVKWLGLTITSRLGKKKPKKTRKKITKTKRKINGRALGIHLWQQRELVEGLIIRLGRFALEVVKTLSLRNSEAAVSLPDPMWNGVLYGVLTNIRLQNVDLSVNFENHNFAKIWVTVYPYRVAGKLAALLVHLPYIRILRFAWDLKKITSRRSVSG